MDVEISPRPPNCEVCDRKGYTLVPRPGRDVTSEKCEACGGTRRSVAFITTDNTQDDTDATIDGLRARVADLETQRRIEIERAEFWAAQTKALLDAARKAKTALDAGQGRGPLRDAALSALSALSAVLGGENV